MEHDEARRRFCMKGLAGITGTLGLSVLGAGGIFLGAPAFTNRAEGKWVEVGSLDDLEADTFTQVTLDFSIQDGWAYSEQKMLAYVKREGDELTAFSATCTHLGCNVRWDKEKNQFICPCHAGIYDTTGQNISGPPPKPLIVLPVKLEEDTVMVYNKSDKEAADA